MKLKKTISILLALTILFSYITITTFASDSTTPVEEPAIECDTPPNDGGTPPDGDTPPNDGGTPPDGDTPPYDGGTPPDGDTPPGDGGTPPNSGTPPDDGGTPPNSDTPPDDGGTPPDGDIPPAGGGTPPDGDIPPAGGGTPPDGDIPASGGNSHNPIGGAPGGFMPFVPSMGLFSFGDDCEDGCDCEDCEIDNKPDTDAKEITLTMTEMSIIHNGATVSQGSEIEIKDNDVIVMIFNWSAPETSSGTHINNGDWGEVRLWDQSNPPPTHIPAFTTGLMKWDYETIGTYTLNNGLLRIDFNDALENKHNVRGTFSLETSINITLIDDVTTIVKFLGDTYSFTFTLPSTGISGNMIQKWNTRNNDDGMSWRIDVNRGLVADPQNTTVVDTITPSGGAIASHLVVPDSIKVFLLDINPINGVERGSTEITDGFTLNVAGDNKSFSVDFHDLSRKAYRITYDSIVDPAYTENGTTYRNEAAIGGERSTAQVTRRLIPQTITNRKTGTFTQADNTTSRAFVLWSIFVNTFGAELESDTIIITDTLGPGQEFMRMSTVGVQTRLRDPITGVNGAWALISPSSYTVVVSGGIVTITIPNARDYHEYEIRFLAHVTDETLTHYSNTATVNQGTSPVSATIPRTGNDPFGNSHRVTKAQSTLGTNNSTVTSVTNRRISWEVNLYTRNTEQTVTTITDTWTLPAGTTMELVNSTMQIVGIDNTTGASMTIAPSNYTITNNADGFTVTFTTPLEIGRWHQLRLRFTTRYELPLPDGNGQVNGGAPISFSNRATINGISGDATYTIPPASMGTFINASKSGSYRGGGELAWTITFNSVHNPLDANILLTDGWIAAHQRFDPDSLRVSVRDNASSSWVDGSAFISSGPDVNAQGDRFTINFQDLGSRAVRITYISHRVGDPQRSYTNVAQLGDGVPFSATISNVPTGLLGKAAALGSDSADNTVVWTLNVNEAGLVLSNAKIVDVLGPGHRLVPGSIVIRSNSGNGSGLLTQDTDYTIKTEYNPVSFETTITITFLSGYVFNARHTVTYTTRIDDDTIGRNAAGQLYVSNRATLSGDQITTTTAQATRTNYWTLTYGTGSGDPVRVEVLKLCAETQTPLPGAVFQLKTEPGGSVFATVTTGDDGLADIGNLRAGTFWLYELTPPDGYALPSNRYQSFTVSSYDTMVGLVTVTFENEKVFPLTIVKNFAGIDVPPADWDAMFTLYREAANGDRVMVSSVDYRNFNNGDSHTFTGLIRGTYIVEESNAGISGFTLVTTIAGDGALGILTGSSSGAFTITNTYTEIPPPPPDDPPPVEPPPVDPPPVDPPPVDPPPVDPPPVDPPPVDPPPVDPPPVVPPPVVPIPIEEPPDEEEPDEEEPPIEPDSESLIAPPPPAPPAVPPPPADPATPPADPASLPADLTDITDEPAATSSNPLITLLENIVPLGGFREGVAWSLLNLMMSIVAILSAVMLLVTIFTRKRKSEKDEANRYDDGLDGSVEDEEIEKAVLRLRLTSLKIVAVIAGIIPGILFLILENIRLPLVWITRWTPLIGAFFILYMVLLLIQFVIKKRVKDDAEEDEAVITEDELQLVSEGITG